MKHTTKILIAASSTGLLMASVFAHADFVRTPTTGVAPTALNQPSLGALQAAPASLEIFQKPALRDCPQFTLADIKASNANQMVRMKNGRQGKASDILAKLNSTQQKLCAKGHSLKTKNAEIGQIKVDTAALESSKASILRAHTILSSIQEAAKNAAYAAAQSVRKEVASKLTATATRVGGLLNPATLLSSANFEKVKPATAVASKCKVDCKDPFSAVLVCPILAAVPGVDKSTICIGGKPIGTGTTQVGANNQLKKIEKSWNWSTGNTSSFEAHLNGKFRLEGKSDRVELAAEGSAGGAVLGYKKDVFGVRVDAYSKTNGDAYGSLKVDVMGSSVYNKSLQKFIGFKDTFKKSLDWNKSFNFWIGPIPVTVRVGASGEAGFSYDVHLSGTANALGAKISADVTPFVNAKVYVSGGIGGEVDLWLCTVGASGGVYGSLTLIDDRLSLGASASVFASNAGPGWTYNYFGRNKMTLLSGEIGLYAKIDYCFDDANWKLPIFKWGGIKLDNTLFEGP